MLKLQRRYEMQRGLKLLKARMQQLVKPTKPLPDLQRGETLIVLIEKLATRRQQKQKTQKLLKRSRPGKLIVRSTSSASSLPKQMPELPLKKRKLPVAMIYWLRYCWLVLCLSLRLVSTVWRR